MAYTGTALSFMLTGLDRPVVLTGSQRPLGEVRTDARLNLIDATTAAVEGPPEVMICFDSKLFRANRCTKVKVDEYDAFESPNFPPLGTLGVRVRLHRGLTGRGPLRLREKLDSRVFLLKVFPGISPEVCLGLLDRVRGLVVEAFGAGNFPLEGSGRSLLPFFERAKQKGCRGITSQAHRDGVDLGLYESGSRARAWGHLRGGHDYRGLRGEADAHARLCPIGGDQSVANSRPAWRASEVDAAPRLAWWRHAPPLECSPTPGERPWADIQFVENYSDLSTNRGYQFKFHCDRCGNGYLSSFEGSTLGMASGLLERRELDLRWRPRSGRQRALYEVQQAIGGQAHDSALQKAVAEIKTAVQAVPPVRQVGLPRGLLERGPDSLSWAALPS